MVSYTNFTVFELIRDKQRTEQIYSVIQILELKEFIDAYKKLRKYNWDAIVSHDFILKFFYSLFTRINNCKAYKLHDPVF